MPPNAEPMKKILLASSSPSLLNRNMNLLKRRGFQLMMTTSGKEALEYHRQHSLDLILADLTLDDMGGDTLCDLVRSEGIPNKVSVILICYDIPENRTRVAESCANGMIVRPIMPENLMETVQKYLAVQMVRSKRIELLLRVEVNNRNANYQFCCLSRDLSSSGILLETNCKLEPGSHITCKFTIPHSCTIEAEGYVARSITIEQGLSGYGIQFIDLPARLSRELETYVSRFTG